MEIAIVYPYRIRTTDVDLIDIIRKASKQKIARIPTHNISCKLGRKLAPIRKDINILYDRELRESFFSIKKQVTVEMKPSYKKKNGYDLIFKKLF